MIDPLIIKAIEEILERHNKEWCRVEFYSKNGRQVLVKIHKIKEELPKNDLLLFMPLWGIDYGTENKNH